MSLHRLKEWRRTPPRPGRGSSEASRSLSRNLRFVTSFARNSKLLQKDLQQGSPSKSSTTSFEIRFQLRVELRATGAEQPASAHVGTRPHHSGLRSGRKWMACFPFERPIFVSFTLHGCSLHFHVCWRECMCLSSTLWPISLLRPSLCFALNPVIRPDACRFVQARGRLPEEPKLTPSQLPGRSMGLEIDAEFHGRPGWCQGGPLIGIYMAVPWVVYGLKKQVPWVEKDAFLFKSKT